MDIAVFELNVWILLFLNLTLGDVAVFVPNADAILKADSSNIMGTKILILIVKTSKVSTYLRTVTYLVEKMCVKGI